MPGSPYFQQKAAGITYGGLTWYKVALVHIASVMVPSTTRTFKVTGELHSSKLLKRLKMSLQGFVWLTV